MYGDLLGLIENLILKEKQLWLLLVQPLKTLGCFLLSTSGHTGNR